MAEKSDEPTPLASALGRIPTGLYIVTTIGGESGSPKPLGFVGSFFVQVGFDPPSVAVAIGCDRAHLAAARSSGRFAVSILDAEGQGLMGAFFEKYPEGESAFDHLETETTDGGCLVLSGALAWLDCKVTGEHDVGDHVVVFGTVESGGQKREGDPSVHLRKNGLGY